MSVPALPALPGTARKRPAAPGGPTPRSGRRYTTRDNPCHGYVQHRLRTADFKQQTDISMLTSGRCIFNQAPPV
jgi:hypothetical protein